MDNILDIPLPPLLFDLEDVLPSSEPIVDCNDLAEKESTGDREEILPENSSSGEDNKAAKKRIRGPGRPSNNKSLLEKRREANSRERKRMRALVRWCYRLQ